MSDGDTGDYHDKESIATIQAALDACVSPLNTADVYGMGRSELPVRDALKGRRGQAFNSEKFGGLRDPRGAFIGFDSRPVAVRNYIAYSMRRLARTPSISMNPRGSTLTFRSKTPSAPSPIW